MRNMVKFASYGALAAFLAPGVYGGIPDTAEGWYTPSGGFKAESGTGTVYSGYNRETGEWERTPVTVTLTEDGKWDIDGGTERFGNNYALRTAYDALLKACANEAWNMSQEKSIRAIGENLHNVLNKQGIVIEGTDANGNRTRTTIRLTENGLAGTGEYVEGEKEEQDEDLLDGRSLDWNGGGKAQVYGWQTFTPSAPMWGRYDGIAGYPSPFDIPVRLPDKTLGYKRWMGVDAVTLSPNAAGTLGLKGWDYSTDSGTRYLANVGGYLRYVAATNAPCGCSNRWDDLLGWLPDGAPDGDGIRFDSDGLFRLLLDRGVAYGTRDERIYFDNSNETAVAASFGAPVNWADGSSLESTGGVYQVAGFATARPCDATLGGMLGDPGGDNAGTHLFLAKKTDTGRLHYVAIGPGVAANVDGESIVTNASQGASADGAASIAGWASASDGQAAVKRGRAIAWEHIATARADGVSIVTNEAAGLLSVAGFATAPEYSILQKGVGGGLVWNTSFPSTNAVLLAGAGINLTGNGAGAVTISAQTFETEPPSSFVSMDVVTDVRYDEQTHKLQVYRRTISFNGVISSGTWVDVFTAVSHAGEHE